MGVEALTAAAEISEAAEVSETAAAFEGSDSFLEQENELFGTGDGMEVDSPELTDNVTPPEGYGKGDSLLDWENEAFGTGDDMEVDSSESAERIKSSEKGVETRPRPEENRPDPLDAIKQEDKKTTDPEGKNDSSKKTSDGEETDENKELTEEEINERQRAAIQDALTRIRNGEMLTTEELGNLGEMMMDQYYISQGYTPLNKHRVTGLDDKKTDFKTGIDGVYEKTNPDGSKTYVIADAKYNNSQQKMTNDGLQMCDNWIENRLDNAVGKEKADEIREAAEDDPDSVKHEIYHIEPKVDSDGNTHTDIQSVDSEGNKTGEKTIVEHFDEAGNRVEPSESNNNKEAEQ